MTEQEHSSERNLKLIVAYEGTRYAGFQRQRNGLLTIQGVLEAALFRITGETIRIIGAGRTDSGVHARGQVVNFHTQSRLTPSQFQKALNHLLPPDILILEADEVDSAFHACRSARSKTYSYRIYNSELRPVFGRELMYHYRYPLKLEPMQVAAELLLGEHDYRSFQAAGSSAKTTVRTVFFCRLMRQERELRMEINADGFLYHMVRNIVGSLILVGNGRWSPDDFTRVLAAKNRSYAGPTAPACGLCLEEVIY